jgi:hypothetical protein
VGGHHYRPIVEQQVWRMCAKRRYLYKEFRYVCQRCGKKTRWYRWKRLNEITARLKPRW